MPSIGLTIPFALINSFGSAERKLLLRGPRRNVEGSGTGEAAQNMRINSGESSRTPALVINILPTGNIFQFFIFI